MSHCENVVVLGGCGFIGRNLVEYLIRHEAVKHVRIIDKVPPQMAWLNKKHATIFEDTRVEFKSANLINPVSCRNALELTPEIVTWDLVVNCAGETKPNKTDEIYKEGILTLSMNCAKECMRLKVNRYIEISSGCMFSSEKTPHKEDGPINAWTFESKWKLQVENELKKMSPELNFTIIRPAIVYGIGDRRNIATRLLIGAIYKQLGETLKLMWTPDLKLNTVHITDLCRSIVFLSKRNDTINETYNLVDKGNTTQGTIANIVADIFQINHDYWGSAMSSLAKADLNGVVNNGNDKHLASWAEACSTENIQNTPLDPTMTTEHLLNMHIHIDGSKLESIGFVIQEDHITKEKLQMIIKDYIDMGIFPKKLTET